ncbi:MAG: hypothetical protein ACRDIC_05385 [bacterium]
MTMESGGVRQETPRVRVVRRADAGRITTDPLRSALRETERRFLSLQSSAAARASAEVLAEYLAILRDLGEIDEHLQEASGRRDIAYLVDRRLSILGDYCRWLTRRVSAEFFLILQVDLEQGLKRVIAPEAYQMFLRLEEVEDTAREIEMLSDRELMAKLRDGALVRDILEQIRLGDVLGEARPVGPSADLPQETAPPG